jgi:hypothetical protein
MSEEDHHEAIDWIDENLVQLPDLNLDMCIDFLDLSIFMGQWLNDNCECMNNWCDGADITGEGNVDFTDFRALASYWLLSVEGG